MLPFNVDRSMPPDGYGDIVLANSVLRAVLLVSSET